MTDHAAGPFDFVFAALAARCASYAYRRYEDRETIVTGVDCRAGECTLFCSLDPAKSILSVMLSFPARPGGPSPADVPSFLAAHNHRVQFGVLEYDRSLSHLRLRLSAPCVGSDDTGTLFDRLLDEAVRVIDGAIDDWRAATPPQPTLDSYGEDSVSPDGFVN